MSHEMTQLKAKLAEAQVAASEASAEAAAASSAEEPGISGLEAKLRAEVAAMDKKAKSN